MKDSVKDRKEKRYRSNILDNSVMSSLRRYVKSHRTMGDCAESIGITRDTLRSILDKKKCGADTLEKIKKVIDSCSVTGNQTPSQNAA